MINSKNKKIALCLSLDEKSNLIFEKVGNQINFSEVEEVHFVNVFKEEVFFNEFTSFTYPPESEKNNIINSAKEQMASISKTVLKNSNLKKIVFKCDIHHDPKAFMVNYLKENDIGLVVSATRGVSGFKGLFTSSFTDYLVKFSPCPILVLRPID